MCLTTIPIKSWDHWQSTLNPFLVSTKITQPSIPWSELVTIINNVPIHTYIHVPLFKEWQRVAHTWKTIKYKACEVHQPYLVTAILRKDPQSKLHWISIQGGKICQDVTYRQVHNNAKLKTWIHLLFWGIQKKCCAINGSGPWDNIQATQYWWGGSVSLEHSAIQQKRGCEVKKKVWRKIEWLESVCISPHSRYWFGRLTKFDGFLDDMGTVIENVY